MRKLLGLAAVGILCGTIYYLYPKIDSTLPAQQVSESDKAPPTAHTHSNLDAHTDAIAAPSTQKIILPEIITNFDYKQEAENLSVLEKRWPQSKPQLMRLIVAQDAFAAHKIPVVPHSKNELTQRHMGALKVMSLRILMSQEKSKAQQLSDLDFVIQNAKDETIKNIARAARDAVEHNRPFFRDTIDALSNLEM